MALLELKRDGTYFSDENMREREPDLYDTMIGHVQNLGWFDYLLCKPEEFIPQLEIKIS